MEGEEIERRIAPGGKLMFGIGKTTELRDHGTGLLVHPLQRVRGIHAGQTWLRRHEKAVHNIVAPQVSNLIGEWMVAWLMNRVGVFTVVQM